MIIICAYCRKFLGEKQPIEDKRTSHGCCKECLAREIKKLKILEDFKDNEQGEDNGN